MFIYYSFNLLIYWKFVHRYVVESAILIILTINALDLDKWAPSTWSDIEVAVDCHLLHALGHPHYLSIATESL